MQAERFRTFTAEEHRTWSRLFDNLGHCRKHQAAPLFAEGVKALGMVSASIPNLNSVNEKLQALTGWKGVAVRGLEDNESFFAALARKEFPIGNFIRDAADLNYTPAPDVFHDLYGHLPFFAAQPYADFCEEFGVRASRYATDSLAIELWGRLFWFGVEFPLVETKSGRRIFGGGILSSFGESNYALSDAPEVQPFDLQAIVRKTYRIDQFQTTLYCLQDAQQLYDCLPAYESLVREACRKQA